jgi:hypothetical protein
MYVYTRTHTKYMYIYMHTHPYPHPPTHTHTNTHTTTPTPTHLVLSLQELREDFLTAAHQVSVSVRLSSSKQVNFGFYLTLRRHITTFRDLLEVCNLNLHPHSTEVFEV